MITKHIKGAFAYVAKQPFKIADKAADRLCALAGAVGCAQFPAYVQHYTQRLGGHVDEARINVEGWQQIADKTTRGDLVTLIDIYQTNNHEAVVEAGNKAAADVARLEGLENALTELTNANMFTKAYTFLTHVDTDIAYNTLQNFTPNVPTNVEGLAYAGIGLIVGMVAYRTIRDVMGKIFTAPIGGKKKEPEVKE